MATRVRLDLDPETFGRLVESAVATRPLGQDWPRSGAGPSIQSSSAPVMSGAEAEAPPECSPLWGLVLILGEIAVRIERQQTEEHAVVDENAA
jgi:hypothetical protein